MKPILRIFPSSNATNEVVEEVPERVEEVSQRVRILWALVFLVIAGLSGAAWYGYRAIDNHSALLAEIPVLQQRADGTNVHVSSLERKMNEWAKDQMSVMERTASLVKTLTSDVKAARTQAKLAANQFEQRVREELNRGLQRLQGRVENVESVQRETQDRLTAAQTEISSLRQEISVLQKQNAERVTELQQTQGNVDRLNTQLGTVNREVGAHTASLDALNEEVERQPVTFEVSTNKTQQVAPGIYLTVNHTDVTHQKVDGRMQLAEEGRIVWIRGLAANQALTFIPTRENRTHEIVFTGVQQKGVTGYVLLPRATAAAKSAANQASVR